MVTDTKKLLFAGIELANQCLNRAKQEMDWSLDEIDELIISYADNWDLNRMAVVDRNILRLAAYEMIHREDIPPIVSINEAVDIAKKFSTEDSGKFVNGILDKICAGLSRSARAATA